MSMQIFSMEINFAVNKNENLLHLFAALCIEKVSSAGRGIAKSCKNISK
jgi:hypothetical protein